MAWKSFLDWEFNHLGSSAHLGVSLGPWPVSRGPIPRDKSLSVLYQEDPPSFSPRFNCQLTALSFSGSSSEASLSLFETVSFIFTKCQLFHTHWVHSLPPPCQFATGKVVTIFATCARICLCSAPCPSPTAGVPIANQVAMTQPQPPHPRVGVSGPPPTPAATGAFPNSLRVRD